MKCLFLSLCCLFSLTLQATEIPVAIKQAKSLAFKEPQKALETFLGAIYEKGNTPIPQHADSLMLHAGEAFQRMIETEDTYAWEIAAGLLELRNISAKRGYHDPFAMKYQLLYMSCAKEWSGLEDTNADFIHILGTENPLLIKYYSDLSEWNVYEANVFQGLVKAYHRHRDLQLMYSMLGYFHLQDYLEFSPSFMSTLKDPKVFDRLELSFDVDSLVYFPESYKKGLKAESFYSLWGFWLSCVNHFRFDEGNQVVEFMLTSKIPSDLKSAYSSFLRDVLLLSDKYPLGVQKSTRDRVLQKLGKLEGTRMYEFLFRCDEEFSSGKVTPGNLDSLQMEYSKFQKKRGFMEEKYISHFWYQYDLKLALYTYSSGKVEQSKSLLAKVKSKFPADLMTASKLGISWLDFVKVQLHFAELSAKHNDQKVADLHSDLAGKVFRLAYALMFRESGVFGSVAEKNNLSDFEKKEFLLAQHNQGLKTLYSFLQEDGHKGLPVGQLEMEMAKLSNYISGKSDRTVMVDLHVLFPWYFDPGQFASVDVCMSFLIPTDWGYSKGPFSGVAYAVVDGLNQADVLEMGQAVYEYYLKSGEKNNWEYYSKGMKMDFNLDFPTRNGLFQWISIDRFRVKMLLENGSITESEEIKKKYPKVK